MNDLPEIESVTENQHGVLKTWLRGEYGLPATFWIWGVAGSFLLSFIISAAINISEAKWVLLGSTILFLFYSTLVAISTWRSASHFQGAGYWPVLARFAVLAWYGLISMVFFYLMMVFNSEYPNH